MWGTVASMKMDCVSLRAWLDTRRAAERREREEVRGSPLPAQESFRRAMRLIVLSSELHGWPLPEDEHSREEDREGYRRWSRLRSAFCDKHGTRLRSKAS